jgi:NAD(P)-dependent dehydrogenase (short-subunit alcohol dehydrogenase family)
MFDTLARCEARVITVSSSVHKFAPNIKEFNLDDLRSDMRHTRYKIWDLYAHSKLCGIMFAQELQRRFNDLKAKSLSFSVDPGYVQHDYGKDTPTIVSVLIKPVEKLFAKKPQDGAQTVLYCVVMPSVILTPGGHYVDCKEGQVKKIATDKTLARELWNVSSELCGRGSSSC